MSNATHDTVVLGLGNPLMEDDGVGLVLLEMLRAAMPGDQELEFVDGGTWGMSLLPLLQETRRVLILDAVRAGAEPGTVLRGEQEAIPRWYKHPLSPHQIDVVEVMAALELLGGGPEEVVVIGVEPLRYEGLLIELTPPVAAAVPKAFAAAAAELRNWGYEVGAAVEDETK